MQSLQRQPTQQITMTATHLQFPTVPLALPPPLASLGNGLHSKLTSMISQLNSMVGPQKIHQEQPHAGAQQLKAALKDTAAYASANEWRAAAGKLLLSAELGGVIALTLGAALNVSWIQT